MPLMTAERPRLPSASVYSDQPTSPSSVVIFRNENVRQPASQCRLSTWAILIGRLPRLRAGGSALTCTGRQPRACYTVAHDAPAAAVVPRAVATDRSGVPRRGLAQR